MADYQYENVIILIDDQIGRNESSQRSHYVKKRSMDQFQAITHNSLEGRLELINN